MSSSFEEENKWSEIPKELLGMIGKHFNTRIDVLRFRSVCPSWRSTLPPFCPPPPLILPLPYHELVPIPPIMERFTVTHSTIYRLQPPHPNPGFLVRVTAEEDEPNATRLITPMDHSNQEIPKEVSLLDYRVIQISKTYGIKSYEYNVDYDDLYYREPDPCIHKIIFLQSNPFAVDNGCHSAMATCHIGHKVILKPGSQKWNWIEGHYLDLREFITYKGKFYTVNQNGRLIAFDEFGNMVEVASRIIPRDDIYDGKFKFFHGGTDEYDSFTFTLIESFGDLFLLFKYDIEFMDQVRKFKIYKLDAEEHKWVEITSLDDRTLFLGEEGIFTLSAADVELMGFGCKGICLYETMEMGTPTCRFNIRCYNLEDASIQVFHGHPVWAPQEMHPYQLCPFEHH